ncbi:MAG: helix-turn-helix transcriptional regulator [Planctomycetota bacterium]
MTTTPPSDAASTRDTILALLKTQGPQDAAAIAGQLDVTPMAVRQHLYALRDQRLVSHHDERRPVGRPARIWSLTGAASTPAAGEFPDSHGELAVGILAAVRKAFGEAGIRKLIAARVADQAARYGKRLDGKRTLRAKVKELAAIRREEGYMAESDTADDGALLLIENHCPICTAAGACQALCSGEAELFGRVLDGASVTRTEHILGGSRRCVYRIAPGEPRV